MRLLAAASVLLLSACASSQTAATAWIEPLDGQTGVPTDFVLVAHDAATDLPPGYPATGYLVVTDLDAGTLVEGDVLADGNDLTFRPRQRWTADHRFSWTFHVPGHVPHGPELALPNSLDDASNDHNTALFTTDDSLSFLGAALDADGRACLVVSRPVTNTNLTADLRVTSNDVDVDVKDVVEADKATWPLSLSDGDPGPDVVCLDTDTPLDAGAALRVWWGDAAPERHGLEATEIPDVLKVLQHGDTP